MLTYNQREERYKNASSTIKFLYASEDSGEHLRQIFNKHTLAESTYIAYALTFGDVVLGFEEITKLPGLLVERAGIPQDKAVVVAQDLIAFITEHGEDRTEESKDVIGSALIPTPAPETPDSGTPDKTVAPEEPAFIPSYAQPFTGENTNTTPDSSPHYTDDPYRISPK